MTETELKATKIPKPICDDINNCNGMLIKFKDPACKDNTYCNNHGKCYIVFYYLDRNYLNQVKNIAFVINIILVINANRQFLILILVMI